MKIVPVHRGFVKNLEVHFFHPEKWRTWLRKLEGKKVKIKVEQDVNPRSLRQNSFYWLYLGLIEDETGNNADDIHEIAKRKFLPPRFVTFKDEEIKLPATSTNLNSTEFSDYMDKIAAWSGVAIPNPDDL